MPLREPRRLRGPNRRPERRAGVVILTNVNNFLLEPWLSQIARGLAGMLAGVTAPPVSGTRYRDTYRALTAAFVLWLTWRALAVFGLSHWQAALRQARSVGRPPRPGGHTAPALDVGLGVAALWPVPRWTGAPIPTLLWSRRTCPGGWSETRFLPWDSPPRRR
jgi:hypothetical protein